ncbi:MAG: nucleotidyltransferase [Roseburia sp.]|nr:nucleotidyltransferase [Roseburia sp.]MCM1242927.1 nucleotidyltransferase [Roseburia sp.]
MKTVGIIAEYNPFHNGHAYQIAMAREITGADHCLIIMSGDFVQRGTPAVMDKYMRAQAALTCGADLVIELPVHYATASAEYFATGAIALLDKLGVTDCLCFGSECGDLSALSGIADALLSEDDTFHDLIKQHLKAGMSYPQAQNAALDTAFPHLQAYSDILKSPNNILGIEYLKALKKRNSKIEPFTVSRNGAAYHDTSLEDMHSSALAIRNSLMEKGDIRLIKEQVPPSVYALLEETYNKTFPVSPDDISCLLAAQLLREQTAGYEDYFDIDKALSDRIRRCLPHYETFTSFCDLLKTKNMTYTRISRALLHILLNIRQADIDTFRADDYVYYARMLGFKKESSPLLSAVRSDSSIPLISKLADAAGQLSPNGVRMLEGDILASHIYSLLIQQNFGVHLPGEYQRKLVIL